MTTHCRKCLCAKLTATSRAFRRRSLVADVTTKRTYASQSYPQQCMEIVRKYDYEHFLCSLLLPREARTAAFAIRAFNVELAQIRDLVTDRNIGRMRIQFWRDSLEKIYKNQPPHSPVAMELARVIHKHGLKKTWLTRMIDAREENLTDRPFSSLPHVEEYAEKSVSSIHYLLLQSLGVADVNADHAASHIGKALGLCTLLRAVPFHAQRQRCYLPVDLMVLHGISQESVFRGGSDQAFRDLIYDTASQAHVHLNHARGLKKEIPRAAITVFYPATACDTYLKSLQRANFDVFDGRLQQRNNWLPLLLYINSWRSTF